MKVVGILGSPRLGGNTDLLLERFLDGCREAGARVDKVVLNQLCFSPCQECARVRDDGSCQVEDQLQPVFRMVGAAGLVAVATPIFFGSLSAQTKMMVDRFQCWWRAKYLLKRDPYPGSRSGVFLAVEASDREDFFDSARAVTRNFFATIGARWQGEVLCPGLESAGDILVRPECLEAAFQLGRRLAAEPAA